MVEAAFSVAMLGGFLWALRFLLPKAVKEDDSLAIVAAVGIAILALAAWLLMGVTVFAAADA